MSTLRTPKRDRSTDSHSRTPPRSHKRRAKLSPASPPPARIQYHNMPEGYGGLYSVSNHGPFIGTKGCRTCIGVYFEASDEKYFLGHFNTEVKRDANPDSQDEHGYWRIDADDVTNKEKLFREIHNSTYEGFHQALPNGPNRRMRNTLIVVCPQSGIAGKQYVGDAMLSGLLSWLKIQKKKRDKYLDKVVRNEGFIVEFGKGEPLFFDGEEPETWTVVSFAEGEAEELDLTVGLSGKQVIFEDGADDDKEDSDGDDVTSEASIDTDALPEDE
ncbi:hypothetical protein AC579_4216 [Pseudocercospora musae]|uniref:Uncharacterized protein n=1 Tax=Pseudocercospora musae TaxID=113226 RepID=A0A139ID48_9PEZI|nr:hypothetical protein AC579_4216 [Pseudocercospora musae]